MSGTPIRNRTLRRVAGWGLAALLLALVVRQLAGSVAELQTLPRLANPRWSLVLFSGVLVLCAHAVLVQTWRATLAAWGSRLPFWTAARIWSVSNLGRFIPGMVWQIGAMGAMAKQERASPVAASGSAILGSLVNVVAGFCVVLVAGPSLLDDTAMNGARTALLVVVVALAALALAPVAMPHLMRLAGRVTGRAASVTLPARVIWISLLGNLLAWLIYGAAFMAFTHGVLGRSTGSYAQFVAAYTIAYLAGYLFLLAPAGLGVREAVMISVMGRALLASPQEAALVALSSRVWLTILEVTPGFLFWALAGRRPPTPERTDAPI